jgi:hypothetical protein
VRDFQVGASTPPRSKGFFWLALKSGLIGLPAGKSEGWHLNGKESGPRVVFPPPFYSTPPTQTLPAEHRAPRRVVPASIIYEPVTPFS